MSLSAMCRRSDFFPVQDQQAPNLDIPPVRMHGSMLVSYDTPIAVQLQSADDRPRLIESSRQAGKRAPRLLYSWSSEIITGDDLTEAYN